MNDTPTAALADPTSWNLGLVALSYAIAVIGSLGALSAATRIRRRHGFNLFNSLAAGFALGGIGVWSMHFTGMSALNLPMRVGYSMVETVLSLLAASVAASGALTFVAQRPDSTARLLTAGPLLGLGVVVMHYLGMHGMRFPGYVTWSMPLVWASVVIAVIAATAALWLSFRIRVPIVRFLAALVMGLAICAMHYTGMLAADYVCTSPDNRYGTLTGFGIVGSDALPGVIVIVSIGLAVLILADQWLQSNAEERARARQQFAQAPRRR